MNNKEKAVNDEFKDRQKLISDDISHKVEMDNNEIMSLEILLEGLLANDRLKPSDCGLNEIGMMNLINLKKRVGGVIRRYYVDKNTPVDLDD